MVYHQYSSESVHFAIEWHSLLDHINRKNTKILVAAGEEKIMVRQFALENRFLTSERFHCFITTVFCWGKNAKPIPRKRFRKFGWILPSLIANRDGLEKW